MSEFGDLMQEVGTPLAVEMLARTITYTPAGGAGVSRAVLVAPRGERTEETPEGQTARREILVTIRLDATLGVAAPAIGDAVAYSGENYTVVDLRSDPDTALAELTCVALEKVERTREGYRRS